jgi:hypothetical protein
MKFEKMAMALTLLVAGSAAAAGPRKPMQIKSAQEVMNKQEHRAVSQLSEAAKADVNKQRLRSVPHWSGSFTSGGQEYPYTMVGHAPQRGDTTRIDTAAMPVSFVFDEFVDDNGNSLVLAAPDMDQVLRSPDWERANYSTGFTTYSDAIQRAEFWNVMDEDWHTLLERPRQLTPVQIEVPVGLSQLYQLPDGTLLALIDVGFFGSQVNTISQLAGLRETELPLLVSQNAFLYDSLSGGCCILGYHTAYETKVVGNTHFVQTLAWASYISPGIFRDADTQDVAALSHEIAEWYNDPFINNATPAWQFPDGSGACQGDLETGDPVEVLAHTASPVTLHGFTYHPQTEALLQWFSGETPSSAYHGAYSFPDMTALPGPALPCAPAAAAKQ